MRRGRRLRLSMCAVGAALTLALIPLVPPGLPVLIAGLAAAVYSLTR